jgi:predicted TIM-barrel fold metal-dependent hydrolase
VYWGFQYNPVGVREMYREAGVDRIMWATDFPHGECDWPYSQQVIDESFRGIPDEAKHKVIAGNAIEFFHLEGPGGQRQEAAGASAGR